MKISMGLNIVAEALNVSEEEGARVMKQLGFEGVDFNFCSYDETCDFMSDESLEMMRQTSRIIREAGLEISQSHLPYLPGHVGIKDYEEYEQVFLPKFIRSIEFCGEIGCSIAVIHLYFEDDAEKTFRGNVATITKLIPYLEKNNVILAIENTYGGGEAYRDCYSSKAEDIMEYIKYFNNPMIGVCLDTGHAVCTGSNILDMACQYGKHLVALHVNSSSGRDTHLIPGALVDWIDYNNYNEFSKLLKGIGYKGTYNLEISPGYYPKEANVGMPFLQIASGVAKYYASLAE